jgi:hypothetical protein
VHCRLYPMLDLEFFFSLLLRMCGARKSQPLEGCRHHLLKAGSLHHARLQDSRVFGLKGLQTGVIIAPHRSTTRMAERESDVPMSTQRHGQLFSYCFYEFLFVSCPPKATDMHLDPC